MALFIVLIVVDLVPRQQAEEGRSLSVRWLSGLLSASQCDKSFHCAED